MGEKKDFQLEFLKAKADEVIFDAEIPDNGSKRLWKGRQAVCRSQSRVDFKAATTTNGAVLLRIHY